MPIVSHFPTGAQSAFNAPGAPDAVLVNGASVAFTFAYVRPGVYTVTLGSPAARSDQVDIRYANAAYNGATLTRAQLPVAADATGFLVFLSDVGVGGSHWFSDGVRWRPLGGRVTLKNLITSVTNNAAPKVVLDSCLIPKGLWQDGDMLRIRYHKERTGGTADTDATDLMIGTAPTVLGTSTNLNTAALTTTTIQLSVLAEIRKTGATTVIHQTMTGSTGLGGSTTAPNGATVPNMDTQDTYLQVTSDLTTAGGEVSVLRGFTVELICGA